MKTKMSKGQGIVAVKTISEKDMDRRLEAHHEEVVAMLEEARAQRERGEFAPHEPLHVFLKEAWENFEASERENADARS